MKRKKRKDIKQLEKEVTMLTVMARYFVEVLKDRHIRIETAKELRTFIDTGVFKQGGILLKDLNFYNKNVPKQK